ncbi:E3 Ubiquitin ligase [Candidatus Tiddalikarchaeum anstoanum]|nr:E3 Ubiquitin ligase [Candidatus Tiddalikarchaeum anstoanum]
MSSSNADLLFLGFALLIVGLVAFYNGLKNFRLKLLIENTPTSKIRSIAMGSVEVYGKIIPLPLKILKAPFSGRDCVWCKWTVEEWRKSKHGGYWNKFKDGLISDYFYINDNSGTVLVDPKNANVDTPCDFTEEVGSNRTLLGTIRSLKVSTDIFGIPRTLRVAEQALSENEFVYVLGTAIDNPFVAEGTAVKHEADVLISKAGNFFLISENSEKNLLSQTRAITKLGIISGIVMIIIGLLIIFLRLGKL